MFAPAYPPSALQFYLSVGPQDYHLLKGYEDEEVIKGGPWRWWLRLDTRRFTCPQPKRACCNPPHETLYALLLLTLLPPDGGFPSKYQHTVVSRSPHQDPGHTDTRAFIGLCEDPIGAAWRCAQVPWVRSGFFPFPTPSAALTFCPLPFACARLLCFPQPRTNHNSLYYARMVKVTINSKPCAALISLHL